MLFRLEISLDHVYNAAKMFAAAAAMNPFRRDAFDANTNSIDAMDVFSEQDRIKRSGPDNDLYVIVGDKEAEKMQKFAKTIFSVIDQVHTLDVVCWFNVRKTIGNGVGWVDKLFLMINKSFVQIGLVQGENNQRLNITYYYARDNNYDRGTLLIWMMKSRALNLVANIVRLLMKWIAVAPKLSGDKPTSIQITGHGYSSQDGFVAEFAPLIKALQRRKVFASYVTLRDVDRGTVNHYDSSAAPEAAAAGAAVQAVDTIRPVTEGIGGGRRKGSSAAAAAKKKSNSKKR